MAALRVATTLELQALGDLESSKPLTTRRSSTHSIQSPPSDKVERNKDNPGKTLSTRDQGSSLAITTG